MSCYFRHLNEIFDEAGISVSKENRKEVDRAVHEIVGVPYKDCPAAWRAIKEMTREERGRSEFVGKLKSAL